MKIWNNRLGWKTVIEELQKSGYEVVSISKEKTKYDVTKRNGDYSLDDRIWYLNHCEFFIGCSSGLSWLSWAAGAKTVLISGHTKEWYEPRENVTRIINKDVCNGCHNEPEHADKFCCYHVTLCPSNKNFICTRAISPRMVLDAIKENNLID
jgi:autotransporter strand-loop-strand O-heptosyltransferase